jgi:tetratricopeptide (TPR) repeat protein
LASTAVAESLESMQQEFQVACPKPAWWDEVSTKDVQIKNYDDLMAYWQNDDRSKKQFFKAAYEAICNYPLDADIVANALNLMYYGDPAYPHMIQLLEFAIEKYFDYDQPLSNYLGKSGDNTAGIARDLSRLYLDQKQYDKAITLIEKLLASRKDEINDQLLELISQHHAKAYFHIGKIQKATEILREAIQKYEGDWEKDLKSQLKIYEKKSVKEKFHEETEKLQVRALEHYTSGQYDKAASLYKQVLSIKEKAGDIDSMELVSDILSLAYVYHNQGRYADAEPYYKRVLAIREQNLEKDHPKTAETIEILARVYYALDQYEKATSFFERSLSIKEKTIGQTHIGLTDPLDYLARLYYLVGRYAEAESACRRSLIICENHFGPNHLSLGQRLNGLAICLDLQGKYTEAESFYQQALSHKEKVFGKNHTDVATCSLHLAGMYWNQGKFDKAEPLFKRAAGIFEKTYGPNHPSVVAAIDSLAWRYKVEGKFEEAEPLYKRLLSALESLHGSDHQRLARVLKDYAYCLRRLGNAEAAEKLEERAKHLF